MHNERRRGKRPKAPLYTLYGNPNGVRGGVRVCCWFEQRKRAPAFALTPS